MTTIIHHKFSNNFSAGLSNNNNLIKQVQNLYYSITPKYFNQHHYPSKTYIGVGNLRDHNLSKFKATLCADSNFFICFHTFLSLTLWPILCPLYSLTKTNN